MPVLFDTCFLIDLQREMRRGSGRAHTFLADHAADRACIPWTVAGEFGEGFGDLRDPACQAMLLRFEIVPMDQNTAAQYARITRILRQRNLLIGANDLWIAAAALGHGLSLVTNNVAHFSRVPDLSVMTY
jgi:tRNA(fMet)-specific endonuclease VapC